ncbi:hypothetical protein [Rhizocola hellebori]|nr:hypothetical protein [Rhizocola hellebori]
MDKKSLKDRRAVKVTGAVVTVLALVTTLYSLGAPAIIIHK